MEVLAINIVGIETLEADPITNTCKLVQQILKLCYLGENKRN